MYGYESSCPEGVDQNTALLATAAAIGNTGKYFIYKNIYLLAAVGAGVIYRAVTLQQAGRRRRSAARGGDEGAETRSRLQDLVMLGGCGHVSRVTCHESCHCVV